MTFAGTMKSERMSGSPAIAIWIIANEKTSSEKKSHGESFRGHGRHLSYRERKSYYGNYFNDD